mgnify:CR=1 FL=1
MIRADPMQVQQLIEILSTLDPEDTVVVWHIPTQAYRDASGVHVENGFIEVLPSDPLLS